MEGGRVEVRGALSCCSQQCWCQAWGDTVLVDKNGLNRFGRQPHNRRCLLARRKPHEVAQH
eukprot:5509262-Amphidinium_carterae.1